MSNLIYLTGSVLIALAFAAVVVVGGALAAPRHQSVGEPPADLNAESILIPREGASPISGWFVHSSLKQAGVLLLHSVRSNRREMIGRARFLHNAGYNVILIDMQGHGETLGKHISFGHFESRDAHDALRYLRNRLPGQPVGIIGVSLGGAAALLGNEPVTADAVVLEAVYSTIDRAVQNRLAMRLGELGHYLSPLLLWQLEPRLGVSANMLSPVSAISRLEAPVLIIGGSDHRHTLTYETKALFLKAPEPKALWMIEGAKHQNFHRFAPQKYEHKLLEFFGKYLSQYSPKRKVRRQSWKSGFCGLAALDYAAKAAPLYRAGQSRRFA